MATRRGRFSLTPAWLFFDVNYRENQNSVNCSDVPKLIIVNELKFKLLCCQIHTNQESKTGAHFKGIFLIDGLFYMIDDLKKDKKPSVPKKHKVTSCLYYLIE
jgi:hypothetical protein